MSNLSGGHGTTSRPEKMGRFENRDKGTAVERYQRLHGLWREPKTSTKAVVKHRAAKKRRQFNRKLTANADF